MDEKIIWILVALTSIVLLSACFNYTNLSIARSLRRSKEVGIRKVVGASRGQVFTQFVIEAILLSGIAAVIAMGLFFIIKPEFLALIGEEMRLLTLDFKVWYLLPVIGFAIVIGVISGFLPSLFLSKLQALIAIKHPDKIKMFSGVTLRMVLIVFQFTLSIAFIITTLISYKQYKYVLAYDLGFSTENILNVYVQGNDPEVLKTRFSEIAGVVETSRSGMVMSVGEIWGETLKYKDPLDSISVHINPIDRDYLALHDIQLLAGENFRTQAEDSELVQIIVNERVLKRFNMGAPEEVIGETMEYMGKSAEIVGVMPDIQYLKLNSEAEPFLFLYPSTDFHTVNLKIQTADLISVMDQLEEAWQEVDPVHVFNASFYDDRIRSAYAEYEALMKIVGFISALVISIASLGLLGMAVYSTESRIKEISIRKVMGATEQSLVYLISRGYILVIVIAALIAVPLTYLFFEEVLFSDVAYRVTISAVDLGLGLMIIVLIAFSMVGWQTMKAARAHPADTLRDE